MILLPFFRYNNKAKTSYFFYGIKGDILLLLLSNMCALIWVTHRRFI